MKYNNKQIVFDVIKGATLKFFGLLGVLLLSWVMSVPFSRAQTFGSLKLETYVIFGEDNRREVYSAPPQWQEISQSIAGKVSFEHLKSDGSELLGVPLGRKVCPSSRFSEQVTVPSCTGFLAKSNVLITAGHCMKTKDDCDKFAWVFNYALKSAGDSRYTKTSPNQIYKCKRVISQRIEDFGAVDYTIIELDRPVEGRQPLRLGFDAIVKVGMSVTNIGHPSGLPLKFVDGATVIRLSDSDRTLDTDLDVFQGTSGSPVFDGETGVVIGINSHGHSDYRHDGPGNCRAVRVCLPGDNCHWSASSRISNLRNEPIFKSE